MRSTPEVDFYRAVAQASLTLLGLWWVVAQFKYREWADEPRGRRLVTETSLYFLLPGIVSLLALAAVDTATVWRVSFAAACVLGAWSSGRSLRHGRGTEVSLPGIAPALALVLYAAILVVAAAPGTIGDAFGLRPLELEAILVSLLLLLGAGVAGSVLVRGAR